ncbi:MAG: potassium/proton antiporter [Pirellulaceae bacterium]|nr:potassium/proton antiporter [Pirellulaceae bacterium]
MDFAVEPMVLIAGTLLFASIVFSKLSDRFGIPTLLLFLTVGMLAGSEGIGGIAFESPQITRAVGTVALLLILFAGGLDTEWKSIKPVLAPGLVLSTVGVVMTALLLGAFASFILGSYSEIHIGRGGLAWLPALLLAAIVSSTDAAAVFGVFRTSEVQPPERIRYLLEFESGSNDPMAVLLTTAILGFMTQDEGIATYLALDLVLQLGLGAIIGWLLGFTGTLIVNYLKLSSEGLYPLLVLAIGLLTFGVTELTGGNGFLSVYVAGLVLRNGIVPRREAIISFHDGLSWLAQISMFIVLGLFVFPSRLPAVAIPSLVIALFLMFIARPISVTLCLLPFRQSREQIAFVSWVGLRGSVPIVLATFPATYGIEGADDIFNVVFFIVLTSVLIQGLSLIPCTRWLFPPHKKF